ncbi:unnamed protein product [Protopolystoma xenopodis]|uniref:Uncharacterized protein n=1 Tax=Protopolystoma xenopodis TaxID=117903 RepID=A0A3S5A699_9PLAT|nr:unnamed protein product [Protopolystoma xenopodis]
MLACSPSPSSFGHRHSTTASVPESHSTASPRSAFRLLPSALRPGNGHRSCRRDTCPEQSSLLRLHCRKAKSANIHFPLPGPTQLDSGTSDTGETAEVTKTVRTLNATVTCQEPDPEFEREQELEPETVEQGLNSLTEEPIKPCSLLLSRAHPLSTQSFKLSASTSIQPQQECQPLVPGLLDSESAGSPRSSTSSLSRSSSKRIRFRLRSAGLRLKSAFKRPGRHDKTRELSPCLDDLNDKA